MLDAELPFTPVKSKAQRFAATETFSDLIVFSPLSHSEQKWKVTWTAECVNCITPTTHSGYLECKLLPSSYVLGGQTPVVFLWWVLECYNRLHYRTVVVHCTLAAGSLLVRPPVSMLCTLQLQGKMVLFLYIFLIYFIFTPTCKTNLKLFCPDLASFYQTSYTCALILMCCGGNLLSVRLSLLLLPNHCCCCGVLVYHKLQYSVQQQLCQELTWLILSWCLTTTCSEVVKTRSDQRLQSQSTYFSWQCVKTGTDW